MPLAGPVSEGRKFFCPRCGALYSVTYSQESKQEINIAKCVVCFQLMDESYTKKVPVYKLIHRPEDA
jgi:transcription elongation factor Elf1